MEASIKVKIFSLDKGLEIIENVLSNYDLDLTVRAEALDVEVFVEIANVLS